MLAIYARQSVERDNSISIETQIEYCKAMIKPEERKEKLAIYTDEGCSGGNTNRPAFMKMIQDIQQGLIHKVLTYKLDRISRSLSDFIGILQVFKEHNVAFFSASETFDTASAYGDLILKILIVFAEFERTSIINRITDAYTARSEMGFYMGGRRPYGFTLEPAVINGKKTKKFAPLPGEASQLQYIFKRYAQEGLSLRQLQKDLIQNAITPLNGSSWTTAKLSTILKNPIYVQADADVYAYYQSHNVQLLNPIHDYTGLFGAQLYGKTKHDSELTDWSDMKLILMPHQGIISSELWLKCQAKLQKNRQFGNALSNKTSWLAGKVKCAKCGHTMTTIKGNADKNKHQRRYFICTGKSHKRVCTGITCTVYAEDLENILYEYIGLKLRSLKVKPASKKHTSQPELNDLKIKLKEIEAAEIKLVNTLLENDVSDALFELANAKAKEIKKNKAIVLEKIEHIKKQTPSPKNVICLSERWNQADFEEKKAVAAVLVYEIRILEDGTIEIIWNL